MARTHGLASSRADDVPEMSELMAPFLRTSDLEGKLTPYKVVVLVLLEQYTNYSTPEEFKPVEKRRVASGFMKLFRLTHLSMKDLRRFLIDELNSPIMTNIFDNFAQRVAQMDFDLFVSFFYGCIAALICADTKPVIRSNSVAGQFARKMLLSYKKASFTDICRLWNEFRIYFVTEDTLPLTPTAMDSERMDTGDIFRDRRSQHSSIGRNGRSNSGELLETEHASGVIRLDNVTVIPTQKEALAFILRQAYLLEYAPTSVSSYSSIDLWIRKMVQHFPGLCELYFLEYLNEIRIRNFSAAQYALHRYFDCAGLTMMNKSVFDISTANRLTGPANIIIPMNAFRSLRYGPLLLADMHRRFGNQEKAMAYLQECIKNAEEANDKTCLDYAITLFTMLDHGPRKTEYDQLIDRVLKDTEDRNAPALHLHCHLAQLLKTVANCGTSKNIVDISHLVYSEIHEKLRSSIDNGKDHCGNKASGSIKRSLQTILSSAYLQRGYWDAACLEAQKLAISQSIQSADVRSIGIVNLAYALAAKGNYKDARKVLSESKKAFCMCTEEFNRLSLAEVLIGFEISFLNGDDAGCKRYLCKAETLSPNEAVLRRAVYNAARDTYSDAVSSMTAMLLADGAQSAYMKCRILFILGQLFLHRVGNAGKAQEYFIQCQQLAINHNFGQLKMMATYELMETKTALSMALSTDVKGQERPIEDSWSMGALHTACAGLSKARTLLRCSKAEKAKDIVHILDKVMQVLRNINGKLYQRQAYALLAIAYDRMDNKDERNRMSKAYRDLHCDLKKSGFTAIVF